MGDNHEFRIVSLMPDNILSFGAYLDEPLMRRIADDDFDGQVEIKDNNDISGGVGLVELNHFLQRSK